MFLIAVAVFISIFVSLVESLSCVHVFRLVSVSLSLSLLGSLGLAFEMDT